MPNMFLCVFFHPDMLLLDCVFGVIVILKNKANQMVLHGGSDDPFLILKRAPNHWLKCLHHVLHEINRNIQHFFRKRFPVLFLHNQ